MARGKSGRIVLEIDASIKRNLYLALEQNETTLKDWFLKAASSFIELNQTANNINWYNPSNKNDD